MGLPKVGFIIPYFSIQYGKRKIVTTTIENYPLWSRVMSDLPTEITWLQETLPKANINTRIRSVLFELDKEMKRMDANQLRMQIEINELRRQVFPLEET
jgi:hypothetical protein